MRTLRQAQFDVVLRTKHLSMLGVEPISLPIPAQFLSHQSDIPSIFSGLEREQKAIDDAVEYAFKVHDYSAVYDTLDFLKFSRSSAEAIVSVVSTVGGFVSGVGAVISAVQTISKVLEFMGAFDSGGFNIEAKLNSIGEEVHTIYVHLLGQAEQEKLQLAEEVRNTVARVKDMVDSVAVTGLSDQSIDDLADAIDRLDEVIDTMLALSSARIPFSPASYKTPFGDTPWYHYSGTPYLETGDGGPTPTLTALSSYVWDPGHYVDALATAIRLRVSAGATLEPLFRTTNYRLPRLQSMVPKLLEFIEKWESSFRIASPFDCMLADGTITIFKMGFPGTGILIGAVCPVTGISSLQLFSNFAHEYKATAASGLGIAGSPGTRTLKALYPGQALQDAVVQHQLAVNRVKQSCGLSEFRQLHARLKDLAQPPRPTESVHFEAVKRFGSGGSADGTMITQHMPTFVPQQTTIDLGELKEWSADPGKTYPATRYFTSGGKIVTLRLGRRARVSGVRTGYKLRIAGEVLELTSWAAAPAPEDADQVDWFPSTPIDLPLTLQTKVYDCVQSRPLTGVEEESYDESGDADNAQRLLINERDAVVNVRVQLEFSALADGDNRAHLGEVTLTFTPDHVLDQPHAYLIDIEVLETHVNSSQADNLEEVVVDGLSLHMIPSWLKVQAEFFDDYQDAMRRMLKAKLDSEIYMREVFVHEVPDFVDPRPKFFTVQEAAFVARTTKLFELAKLDRTFAARLENFMVPR
jgi:hypothetical protein